MRRLLIIPFVLTLFLALVPVEAQVIFGQGFHEFEDNVAGMTYTGSWTTTTVFGSTDIEARTTSGSGASVDFMVDGKTVVIWRLVRSTGVSARMSICVNSGSCITVINESTAAVNFWEPFVISVPFVGSHVEITQTLGSIHLNSFMVLSDPSLVLPVPTATIIPSSTPASTTTPQPTPTPQPTSTPMSVIVAIDPQRSYSSEEGQITAFDYSASAGDVHIANLLTAMLVSLWGFFVFAALVLVRFKK